MTGFKQLAYAGVMMGAAFAVHPTGKYGPAADSTVEERNRLDANVSGGVNPSDYRANSILKNRAHAGEWTSPRPAEPMPPTSCRSVEPIPWVHTGNYSGPHRVHTRTVMWFETESGFGIVRMMLSVNSRGIDVPSSVIDRVELVSLLTDDKPSVYVLDDMPTIQLSRQAKRRPLDEFERLGLEAVRRGQDLVGSREAPTRMFGAIRAHAICLECHTSAKAGDLLGAFTYYLNKPVDQLYDE